LLYFLKFASLGVQYLKRRTSADRSPAMLSLLLKAADKGIAGLSLMDDG
jgi:hypothetical protein